MLSSIRKITVLNRPIAFVLKKTKSALNKFFDYIIMRWPTKGKTDCTFNGTRFFLYNKCDDGLVNYFHYGFKYHEEGDISLFTQLAVFCNTVIDVGANTGVYSILTSLKNGKANIIAFEPHTSNFERLKKNLSINNCKNVKCEMIALGEANGEIAFTVPDDNRITDVASVVGDFSKNEIKTIKWKQVITKINTLDFYRRENSLKIDLIKCDVESYETSFFKGLEETIREDRPVILFESFMSDEKIKYFNNIVARHNYTVYLVFDKAIVHLKEGFVINSLGVNFLITPLPPPKTVIPINEINTYIDSLLLRN